MQNYLMVPPTYPCLDRIKTGPPKTCCHHSCLVCHIRRCGCLSGTTGQVTSEVSQGTWKAFRTEHVWGRSSLFSLFFFFFFWLLCKSFFIFFILFLFSFYIFFSTVPYGDQITLTCIHFFPAICSVAI